MIKELLNTEGPVIGFLDKTGQLIVLSVMWIVGCLPVVTAAASTAALYYAVIKSVRRGQGNAWKEFLRSYRANLVRGIPVTVVTGFAGVLFAMNIRILQGQNSPILSGGNMICMILLVFACVYIGPVLSRFQLSITQACKLAFVMSLRFAHYTLLILAGAGAVGLLQMYILPIPTILILPGLGCWLATFPVEKALRLYMPEKEESDNTWYYET